MSWLWPALVCANINLGFSLAQPGSSQGETPLGVNNETRISYGGVGKCSFPRVGSGIGKSHSGLGLGRNFSPFGADGRGSMGTRELYLKLFPLRTQDTPAAERGSLRGSCSGGFRQAQGGSSEMSKGQVG